MSSCRILSLDQATSCGYCVADTEPKPRKPELIESGTFTAIGKSRGERWWKFEYWLHELIILHRPELIVFESNKIIKGRTQVCAYGYFTGVIESLAYQHDIDLDSVDQKELKKWATGNSKADKDEVYDTVARSQFPDHLPVDDNESDAICIYLWAKEQLD